MPSSSPKKARVEISLPDGTELKVTGPLAEEIARRLMQPCHHWHPYPTYTWTSGSTTGGSLITSTTGATINA